jgi:chemotaxis-related protein WspB
MQSLRFRVGERALAVDLRWIHEVCPLVNIRPLPQAPMWMRGLFDFHGQLLPVVDAGVMLGGAPVQQCVGARILLLHGPMNDEPGAPKATYGLLVDSVEGLLQVDRADAWTARDGLPGLPFLRDVVNQETEPLLLLDAARMSSMHASLLEGPAMLATVTDASGRA